ncbi:hypothetical protein T439DRAFT_89596 [Meredithblackwellia eburnea MCA 4105]
MVVSLPSSPRSPASSFLLPRAAASAEYAKNWRNPPASAAAQRRRYAPLIFGGLAFVVFVTFLAISEHNGPAGAGTGYGKTGLKEWVKGLGLAGEGALPGVLDGVALGSSDTDQGDVNKEEGDVNGESVDNANLSAHWPDVIPDEEPPKGWGASDEKEEDVVHPVAGEEEDEDEDVDQDDPWADLDVDKGKYRPSTPPKTPSAPKLEPLEDDELPVCNRTALYRFANRHGFGSEFSILIRASLIATHYGYTLLLDTSKWNYGSFDSYFLPPSYPCKPPPTDIPRKSARTTPDELANHRHPKWTKQPHVTLERDIDGLDQLALNLYTSQRDLDALREEDRRKLKEGTLTTPLTPEETIPEAFWKLFRLEEEELKKLWRPNEEIWNMVGDLETNLGLEDDEEREVIAMHVRLGDKYREVDNFGPAAAADPHHSSPHRVAGPGLHSDAIAAYLIAAKSVTSTTLAATDSTTSGVKPVLAVMSDDPDAWKHFEKEEQAKQFRVVGTTGEKEKRLGKRSEDERDLEERDAEEINPQDDKPLKDGGGFNESAFNRLSLAQRIALTRTFVRDITFLTKRGDSLVMSASSNVGRLMALLTGSEKAIGMRRVVSVDTRWFPTARFH